MLFIRPRRLRFSGKGVFFMFKQMFGDSMKKKEKWNTLDGILNEIWKMLQRGVTHANDPFHSPVLGTIGNGENCLRMVILRDIILPDRILVCHTDVRASKVKEIHDSNRVSWLFYHPKKQVQLRISGKAKLHADDLFAEDQWVATQITSRLNYCAVQSPGTSVGRPSDGVPDSLKQKMRTLLNSEIGRKHFMAISCRIDSIDWLKLSIVGNRRARFDWDKNRLSATWLIP